MSVQITIKGAHVATAGMVGLGLVAGAAATNTAASLVGGRYLDQVFADPIEMLHHRDGMVLERKRTTSGDSATLFGVALGVVAAGIGGMLLFAPAPAKAKAAAGAALLRRAGGWALLGGGMGVGGGSLIARQYFKDAAVRPL